MTSTVGTIIAVTELGGLLECHGNRLRMMLPPDAPAELKAAIRLYKPVLLDLLRRNWLLVRSDAVNGLMFWTDTEETKSALVAAGATPGLVYTQDELERLLNKRVTCADIAAVHAAKNIFEGRITHDQ